jgi:serine/threonine protein kinase
VGIATIATATIIIVLYALMLCKYCFYKHNRKQLRTTGHTYDSGGAGGTGNFTKAYSHKDSFRMNPRYTRRQDSGTSVPPATRAAHHYTEDDIRQQRRRTYIGSRQFPSENLVLLMQLGEGDYGPVYRGEAYGIVAKEKSRIVTVMMLKSDAENDKRALFEQEITRFSNLNHLNVVGVLGVCTETSPECIIFDAGNLHMDVLTYIREKGVSMKGVSDGEIIIQEFRDLLRIADEVCLGLSYLCSQHIVHKDVALRNCIRGQNGVVKVASFGLGSKLYPEAYYTLHGRSLPLRWLSPEAITQDAFSTESDIWAFGVLMWELFTYGEQPYPDLTNEEVICKVSQECSTLPLPDMCPEDVFLVMSSCWNIEPASRPKFLVLHQHIFDLISPHLMEDHGD